MKSSMPKDTMTHALWTKIIEDASIQRSSQTLSVLGDDIYIYGGELRPREPVDSAVHRLSVHDTITTSSLTISSLPNPPQPRVGAASTALNGQIYIFSGRGGLAMAPIEETGAFQILDPQRGWSYLKPDNTSPYPQGRSYHALTNNGSDTIYLHAGCPETGRLRDLWAFHVPSRVWTQLPSAPGPERGGSSIAYSDGKIYRMNGFDGAMELGGAVDVFDLAANEWRNISYAADGVKGPIARSVACLLALRVGGRQSLVTMFGERETSDLGHLGAGKMLSDMWVFDIQSEMWRKVVVDSEDRPPARGWFGAGVVGSGAEEGIVVQGGLGESNDRLGDVWMLKFEGI
ncbi:kelch repeat-containing protein [Aspergillus steynii IBT 23096]|uniref:Kelch repeat-containing protein n=1 Tax=Aspergillus steynii IBT 23096 TaxID=1392250 RepID=A0A2I2FRH0_9EURO|nr:kelch repeat-containing protein [Aspergillus steynii IBT 23096]PLB43230.1 kelch repeat-containing protein [Aspergillus steynii IBT 23096]